MISLERLAEALRVVRESCPDLAVVAIRWMHLKYPLHPVQEALLRETDRSEPGGEEWPRGWMATLGALARCLLHNGSFILRLATLHRALGPDLARLRRQRFDVIAKTCCFGPDRPTDGHDFYYGDLQARMGARGVRLLLLCSDARGGSWTTFARAHLSVSPAARLPELLLVPPLAPLWMLGQQLRAWVRLRRVAARARDPLVRRISRLASRDCLASDTALAGLDFWVGKAAVRIWRPRAFLTFYEGHAWEQCLRWGAKVADPACRMVGYQHTTIFRECLSVTSPPDDVAVRALPDVVLCGGAGALELLRPGHERYRIRMLRFGSLRQQGAASPAPADPGRRTILVTPQGVAAEVKILFGFAHECARRLPSYTFVLRCHPELPMARALALVAADLRQQPNIVLSEGRSLEDDLARASGLLYWGSSTVIYAILRGLLPVYLDGDDGRDRDPLYGLQHWRRRCARPEAFPALLEHHEAMSPADRHAEWTEAVRYVESYAEAVDDDRIEAFLSACALDGNGR